jgi:hypothetical protein
VVYCAAVDRPVGDGIRSHSYEDFVWPPGRGIQN